MKLKEFNFQNTISGRGASRKNRVATIGINLKNGLFRFNEKACELLGLHVNDQVVFLQDQDDPQNWYLEKVKKDGFVLRAKKEITGGLLFNSTKIARTIAESVDFTGTSGRLLLAGQPTKFEKRVLFGVITSQLFIN